MLYRLERVHKGFGTKSVLSGATWQHDPGRVAGLVGRNGAGKSTLLRIVQGLVEPDAGRVLRAGGTTFASLEQAVEPEGGEPLRDFVARAQDGLRELESRMRGLEETIASVSVAGTADAIEPLLAEHDALRERFEVNGGYEADARVERVLLGVGMPRESWSRPVGELSGGQKHRAQIARLLLGEASVPLLDEPTNHLDLDSRERLEEALVEFEGTIVFVSHDRWFVDRIATHVLEVQGRQATLWTGGFTALQRRRAAETLGAPAPARVQPSGTEPKAVRRPDRQADRQRSRARRELAVSRDEVKRTLDARCVAWEEAVQRLEQEVPA